MATKFRPGSDGASQDKVEFRMKVGGTILIVLIALLQMVFSNYQNDAFQLVAGWRKVLTPVLYLASIVALWKFDSLTGNPSSSTNAFVAAGLTLAGLITGGMLSSHG